MPTPILVSAFARELHTTLQYPKALSRCSFAASHSLISSRDLSSTERQIAWWTNGFCSDAIKPYLTAIHGMKNASTFDGTSTLVLCFRPSVASNLVFHSFLSVSAQLESNKLSTRISNLHKNAMSRDETHTIAWVVIDACGHRERKTADRPFCLTASEVWDRRSPRLVPWAQMAGAPSADPLYGGTGERKWNNYTRHSITNSKRLSSIHVFRATKYNEWKFSFIYHCAFPTHWHSNPCSMQDACPMNLQSV